MGYNETLFAAAVQAIQMKWSEVLFFWSGSYFIHIKALQIYTSINSRAFTLLYSEDGASVTRRLHSKHAKRSRNVHSFYKIRTS